MQKEAVNPPSKRGAYRNTSIVVSTLKGSRIRATLARMVVEVGQFVPTHARSREPPRDARLEHVHIGQDFVEPQSSGGTDTLEGVANQDDAWPRIAVHAV